MIIKYSEYQLAGFISTQSTGWGGGSQREKKIDDHRSKKFCFSKAGPWPLALFQAYDKVVDLSVALQGSPKNLKKRGWQAIPIKRHLLYSILLLIIDIIFTIVTKLLIMTYIILKALAKKAILTLASGFDIRWLILLKQGYSFLEREQATSTNNIGIGDYH